MMDYMVGFDYKDPSTWNGIGKAPKSYTDYLDKEGLKGARIGIVKDLFGDGSHPEHKWVTDQTMKGIDAMRKAGATLLELQIPEAAAGVKDLGPLTASEFEVKWFFDQYFAALGPNAIYKNLAEYVAAAADTHPPVYRSLKAAVEKGDAAALDPMYRMRLENQAAFRDALVAVMDEHRLDALFFPHQRRLVVPAAPDADQVERNGFMASSTGLPAITVPGGFSPPTKHAPIGVPIGVEFLGRPFSEGTLIKLAYAFEQITRHRTPPKSAPPLPGEKFEY
jgi:amidase